MRRDVWQPGAADLAEAYPTGTHPEHHPRREPCGLEVPAKLGAGAGQALAQILALWPTARRRLVLPAVSACCVPRIVPDPEEAAGPELRLHELAEGLSPADPAELLFMMSRIAP